jgi:type I restriction enzyme S subunit
MDQVDGGVKYVQDINRKTYTGGGAKFSNGDTIFARITPCLENGKIAKVKNLEKGNGFGPTELFVFRAIEGASDPDFIYYLAKSETIRQPAIKSMVGASGRQRADKGVVEEIEIDIPPLPTQRRIAAILSAYDDLIENNLKRIRLLEEAAQHIYREWFVHFRFPGHERVRRGADGLPEGWRRVALEDLSLMVKRGVSPEYVTDGGFTVINQKCIRDNQIDLAHAKYSSIDKKIPDERFVRVFDVLVNSTGTGTLGRMAIVKSEMEDTFVDTHVTIVRPDPDQVAPLYLGYQLMEQKPVIENMGRGATNQIELSRSELSGLQTIVPPHELQWAFHNNIHPIIKQVAILTAQSVYAKEARDILLPRLMNRTIEV